MNKLLAFIILLTYSHLALAGGSQWVAISVFDGSSSRVVEHYGKIDDSTFEKLLGEKKSNSMFKLESVYWYDDGRFIKPSESKINGASRGYKNEAIYLRADMVVRIMLVNPAIFNER